jgi:hypothetical protein
MQRWPAQMSEDVKQVSDFYQLASLVDVHEGCSNKVERSTHPSGAWTVRTTPSEHSSFSIVPGIVPKGILAVSPEADWTATAAPMTKNNIFFHRILWMNVLTKELKGVLKSGTQDCGEVVEVDRARLIFWP